MLLLLYYVSIIVVAAACLVMALCTCVFGGAVVENVTNPRYYKGNASVRNASRDALRSSHASELIFANNIVE